MNGPRSIPGPDGGPVRHDGIPVVWSADDGRLLLDWPDDLEARTMIGRDVLAELVHKVNEARARADNLDRALASRGPIERVKGMIMQAQGVDADQAFELLARQSKRHNVKVAAVVADVLAGIRNPGTIGRP